MKYNPRLLDLNSLLKKHLSLLHIDPNLKTIFPQDCITSVFKRNQSLKELLAPSLYPKKKFIRTNSITNCNKCDIWKQLSNMFQLFHMPCRYDTRAVLFCNCNNVIYLITCKNCLEQYVGFATNLKNCFRIHKTDIKTNRDRFGTAKHFNGMRKNNNNIFHMLVCSSYWTSL